MSITLAATRTALQRRLGDASGNIWSGEELDEYIQEGYDDLTRRTGCLFDTAMLPDFAFAFTFTSEFEEDYASSGMLVNGPAQFTCEFERDYVHNARGPANHNYHWEYNSGYVSITEIDALADLPEALQEVERATWNTQRLQALRSSDLEFKDSRYELNKGEVQGFLQDKDGLGVLRKWRVPSAPYVPYTFDDGTDIYAFSSTQSWESDYFPTTFEDNGPLQFTAGSDQPFASSTDLGEGTHNYLWEYLQGYSRDSLPEDGFGILRHMDGILDLDVSSEGFGDLVQVDTVNVFEDYGILGPVYKDTGAVRLEYRRRGRELSAEQGFEIPDRYTVYVRHYAQARALEREGDGQDIPLSQHFQARYEAGVQRMLRRKKAMNFQKTTVMGGQSSRRSAPPLARLPWNFGQRVR
jgi:hypothetical protein